MAKYRNHKFKAKSIRNDIVLHHSSFKNTPDHHLKLIVKILDKRECMWNKDQKKLHQKKILEKLEKAKKQSFYTDKLLTQCKSWKGPATSVDELLEILQKNPDQAIHIIRIELSYYRDTHRSDVISTPELFQLNKISHEEHLMNLSVLLSGKGSTITSLPTAENALKTGS